jgi:hypothetical protein
VAFAHIDVDAGRPTGDILAYLAQPGALAPHSYIVLDDVEREAPGIDSALRQFLGSHAEFQLVHVFPGQGLLFSRPLWDG